MTKEKATTLANQKGYPYVAIELDEEPECRDNAFRVIPEHYLLYGDTAAFCRSVYDPRFGIWQSYE